MVRKKYQRKKIIHKNVDDCVSEWSEAPKDFRGIFIWRNGMVIGALNGSGYLMISPPDFEEWKMYHSEMFISSRQIKQMVRYVYLKTLIPR